MGRWLLVVLAVLVFGSACSEGEPSVSGGPDLGNRGFCTFTVNGQTRTYYTTSDTEGFGVSISGDYVHAHFCPDGRSELGAYDNINIWIGTNQLSVRTFYMTDSLDTQAGTRDNDTLWRDNSSGSDSIVVTNVSGGRVSGTFSGHVQKYGTIGYFGDIVSMEGHFSCLIEP